MLIELSAMEQEVARMLARERQASSREAGLKDAKRSDASAEEVDLEGFAAELAFCKLANIYPDLTPGKKPVDAWTGRGGVDVKATKHEDGSLLVASWKKSGEVAFYVLMIGKFPAYRCAGFMRSEDLLQADRLVPVGRGSFAFEAVQRELQRIEDLLG